MSSHPVRTPVYLPRFSVAALALAVALALMMSLVVGVAAWSIRDAGYSRTELNAQAQAAYERGVAAGRSDGIQQGRAEGADTGRRAGYERGRKAGYARGFTAGRKIGYDRGHTAGYAEGYAAGAASVQTAKKGGGKSNCPHPDGWGGVRCRWGLGQRCAAFARSLEPCCWRSCMRHRA